MRWWELFRQAMIGAARARLRSALTAAGIAIGCGALVSMVAFALGLQQQIEAPFKQLGLLSEIHVTRHGERLDPGDGPPGRPPDSDEPATPKESPPLDDAAVETFGKLPGVKYAYPELRLSDVSIALGDQERTAIAMGAPREAGLADQLGTLITAGGLFTLDDAPQIVLSDGLVKALGIESADQAIGKTVTVSAAGLSAEEHSGQFAFKNKSIDARVVGVFALSSILPFGGGPGGGPGGGAIALIPVDVMQQLPGLVESQLGRMRRAGEAADGGYREVVVRAESPVEVESIAKQITDQGFHARTMIAELDEARLAFLFIKSMLSAVGSVAMVIAGLGIANTLLMTVLERYEEIGLYKAIGATDGDVRWLFLSEAAVLGLVGGLGGLVLAGAVCGVLQLGLNAYLASEGVERTVSAFQFPWWLILSAVGFSVVVSIISGLYPASRAARVEPIQALRRS